MVNVSPLSLPSDIQNEIGHAVRSGEYASEGEVILEALAGWFSHRANSPDANTTLKQLWADGLASGPGRFESIEALKAEARRRKASEAASRI